MPVSGILFFDANLGKLERCDGDCDSSSRLCVHRFDHQVSVEYCNTSKFHGWSDFRVITHCFGRVIESLAEHTVSPRSSFVFLTKDRNFIEDVKTEWRRQRNTVFENGRISLEFPPDQPNRIQLGEVFIDIVQVDCTCYGHRKADDLKCIFKKVNSLLTRRRSPEITKL